MLIVPHLHSQYSDGIVGDGDLMAVIGVEAEDIVPIFLDHGIVYEAVRRHISDFRRHPLIGCEIYLLPEGGDRKNRHLTAIACTPNGVRNLFRLISDPVSQSKLLSLDLEGLLIGSGCMASPFYSAIRDDPSQIASIKKSFEDRGAVFFVELFPWDTDDFASEAARHAPILWSADLHTREEDFDLYELFLLMRPDEGKRSLIHPMKGGKGFAEKMRQAKEFIVRVPPADRLRANEWLTRYFPSSPLLDLRLPRYPDEEFALLVDWLHREAEGEPEHVRTELEREIKIVRNSSVDGQRLQDYFVMLFHVTRALMKGGVEFTVRGSGVGSHVVRLITGKATPDPRDCGCLFERFINPYRVSLPDVDIDVTDQEQAIKALSEQFSIARLATYSRVDDIESILRGVAIALRARGANGFGTIRKEEAFEALRRQLGIQEAERIRDIARRLLDKMGFVVERVGQHAGGFVILPSTMRIPLPFFPRGVVSSEVPVCQFDMDLLPFKIDILQVDGLRLIYGGKLPRPCRIAPHDVVPKEPLLISNAGIFQLGSHLSGPIIFCMADAADVRKSDLNYETIIQAVAGIRPGSFGMLVKYLRDNELLDEKHLPFLRFVGIGDENESGFMFQEDVMRAIHKAATEKGMGEGDAWRLADTVRKAIAKKDHEAWMKAKSVLESIQADPELIKSVEASLGYSFNRAHAVAYAYHAVESIRRLATDPLSYLLEVAKLDREDRKLDRLAHTIFAIFIHALREGYEVAMTGNDSSVDTQSKKILLGKDILGDGAQAHPCLLEVSRQFDEDAGEGAFGFPIRLIADVAPLVAFPKQRALAGVTGYYKDGSDLIPAIFTPFGTFRGPSRRNGATALYRNVVGKKGEIPRVAIFIPIRSDKEVSPQSFSIPQIRAAKRHVKHRSRIAI